MQAKRDKSVESISGLIVEPAIPTQRESQRKDSAFCRCLAERVWRYIPLLVLCGLWTWLVCCLWNQWAFYESYQYGLFVPFLALALCWKRWLDAPEPQRPHSWLLAAVVALLAALVLFPARMIHEANSLWPTIAWPLGLGVMAITLCWLYFLGGIAWVRHFLFPVLFLLAALPWPGSVENKLIQPLAQLNTGAAAEALFICGVPALQQGSTLQLAFEQVGVDEACSGIRSFHSTLMVALLLGELYRLRAVARVALLLGGVFLAFIFNVARTFLLSWICGGKGLVEMGKWHDAIGIGVAAACVAGLWGLALIAKRRKTPSPQTHHRPETSATPMSQPWPIPKWLTVFLLAWLVFMESATRAWFWTREANMTDAAKWSVTLPGAGDDFQSTDTYKILKRSYGTDEITSSTWAESDGSHWQAYYLRWMHGSKTAQAAKGHWPEICMGSAGGTMRALPETKIYRAGNLKLPFRTYIFDRAGTALYVFHCVWEERNGGTSKINLELRPNLLSRVQAAWDGKRNLGQQLLELVVWGYEDFSTAEAAFTRQLEKLIVVEKPLVGKEESEVGR